MIRKIITFIPGVVLFFGFIFVMSAIGLNELGEIGSKAMVIRAIIGAGIVLVGFVGMFLAECIQ